MRDGLSHKLWRDLTRHRARSLLVVLAVAVGLVGAGTILNAWALVQRATEVGYHASLPVSATLRITRQSTAQLAPVLQTLRAQPGLAAVRAHRSVGAMVQAQGSWQRAVIMVQEDFLQADIAQLQGDGGQWPPAAGTLAIERSSLAFSGAALGDAVMVKLGATPPQAMPVAGIVRDVSQAPGWMEHMVYVYATPATLLRLGAEPGYDELQIRVRDGHADRDAVRRSAAAARALIEAAGITVQAVEVPEPGEHVHAAQMAAVLMTQAVFGVLALAVCALLVVNLFNAMLAGQAREIGVLKTLGASAPRIARLYLSQASLLGLLAALLALPAALLLGRAYAQFRAEMLNFSIDGLMVPAWVLALQLAVGTLLPVLAAAWPVRRACRQAVGAALRDTGIVAEGRPLSARRWLRGWNRPLLLALGNAFRRRQRMLLTLLALAAGSAVHLGAANLRNAVIGSVGLLFAGQHHDVSLRLADAQPGPTLQAQAAAVDGVRAAEAWRSVRAVMLSDQGELGGSLPLIGLPADSRMLRPQLKAGRWLQADDSDAAVISTALLKQQPPLWPQAAATSPARLSLTVEGRVSHWRVVGVVDSGPQALAYAGLSAVARTAQPPSMAGTASATAVPQAPAPSVAMANTLLVALSQRGEAAQLDTLQRLRSALAEAGMPVAGSQSQRENRRVLQDHLLMVVDFLAAMGWVMIVVGGIGLASTMGLGVLERTREIGVLRALGARDRSLMVIVQAEGLVIVLLAWAASVPLSVPMSLLLAEAFGRVMFPLPAPWWPDASAALRWLAIMLPISLAACAWPAWRAMRVPAARALSYA